MASHRLTTCPVCGIRRKRYVDNPADLEVPCTSCQPLVTLLRNPVGPWSSEALCAEVDPEMFFCPPNAWTAIAACKRVCAGCPVRDECLAHALEAGEQYGIWGGLTTKERKRLMKGNAA